MRASGRFAGYNRTALRKDLMAGLIVGLIAIPLGMAFAIASGVKPEYGIYTTVTAGILIALFGGSRYQIGGPTGAFIPVLLAIVLQHGYENLLIAGLLAGLILVFMGLIRLGTVIAYIPKPVTIGFTAGIAVIIFEGQIAGFLGLSGLERHERFWMNVRELFLRIDTLQPASVGVAAVCMAVLIGLPRILPKVPAALVGIAAATAASVWLFGGQAATIESVYGAIPGSLPSLRIPELTWDRIWAMLPSAFLIAALGSIESLLSAVVADGMTNTRHNSNRELIGQGIANIVTPLFGGIPATGAIARTAANVKSGAVSPLSGVFHGIVVLAVLLLLAPYASAIPLAAMAPVLMVVAWNMSERQHFAKILAQRSMDSIVLIVTFLLTIFVNLIAGVGIGAALYMVLRLFTALRKRSSRAGAARAGTAMRSTEKLGR